MTIQAVTLLISAISAIAAVVGAIIALLVYLRPYKVQPPKMTVTVGRSDGLYRIEVGAKNWSVQNWAAIEMNVLRPRGSKIVSEFEARQSDGAGGVVINPQTIDWPARSNTCRMYLAVAPRGSSPKGHSALIMGQSDSAHETLLLLVPDSMRSRKLSMRLTLVSNDAVDRAKTITIKRTLPDAKNTAAD